MTYRWRTLRDGSVELDKGDGRGFTRPSLDLDKPGVRVRVARVSHWLPLLRRHARRTGTLAGHLAGLVYQESGGDPDVVAKDNGVGLMQITAPGLKAKVKPGEDLKDPEVNVRIGADYFAGFWDRAKDLPRAAAAYNSGGLYKSTKNPWGVAQFCDKSSGFCHLDGAVPASNYFIARERRRSGGGVALAGLGAAALLILGGSHA